ncbi:glycoside hydrolase family 2 TIM barrel-domain containing protein [Winogradskyella helgolandensis]|uniref:glycoside hydrolase family 2 TIM barrel-domain containing protein n=1 Tax=Winogradskyella helgolandensis TaxID=2697010 RepID=UPI0015B90629|nr:glycoside hydrolase family 2 TIM barrel-domain containing protein [Winogradskyella helgolandensis]
MPRRITYKILLFYIVLGVAFLCETNGQTTTINSGWQFSEDKTTWQTVNIPHTWNQDDAFDDEPGYRRGLGYYQKQVFISSDAKENSHYLKFNAVNQEATVFVNGQEIGNHKGGYTAFNFNISEFINYDAYNVIEVRVDNSHNVDIPPLDADFTFYGGIYRDVELITLPKQHFSLEDFASDGFYINYPSVSEEQAHIEVTAILNNTASKKEKTELKFTLLDAEGRIINSHVEKLKLQAERSEEFKIQLPEVKSPKLWSPENPYLYQLKLVLQDKDGKILDSKTTNIGFRWVSVDPDKGFYLNGKPIKLIGVNRHQDYEGYGNAVPIALQKKDIELIKDMGSNVIRFAHYPHARELYDLCDQLGILVWTEIPVINIVTDSEAYFETSTNMQKEHIKQYYNFPSVVMFGYMNEIFIRLVFNNKLTDQERQDLKKASVKLATQLEDVTRELAPNHITVMAGHLNDVYNETGIADLPMIFGWNLYFGWYDKDIPDLGIFLDEQHKHYPKRSMLLSEYGPGADVRIFTKIPKKFDFSTDYQAKLHQSYYKQITERPYMTGMTAWNYADFGSEFRGDAIPHVNQKGLVQYNRTPKDIYYWYKSVLNDEQLFVHIATDFLKGLTLFEDDSYAIQIVSNQEEGIVYLNGKKQADVRFENGVVTVEMPFVNGINHIKLVSETISEEKTVKVLKLDALDFKNFKRFGINIGAHFYFNDEERDITFAPDQAYKNGWYGYLDGTPYGMTTDKNQGLPHDIKNSTSEPLFQTLLEGCTAYKVDIPDGTYKVDLFFVEPQIKSIENIYNLSNRKEDSNQKKRVFDVLINNNAIEKQFNLAIAYPQKYGVTLTSEVEIKNDKGLTISLQPIEGRPVISGVLIEKIN